MLGIFVYHSALCTVQFAIAASPFTPTAYRLLATARRCCGATKSPKIEGGALGLHKTVGFWTPATLPGQPMQAKHDSNQWQPQNRNCHHPKVPPSTGYPGQDSAFPLKDNDSWQNAGELRKKPFPGTKNRTVTAPARIPMRAWCGFLLCIGQCWQLVANVNADLTIRKASLTTANTSGRACGS